MNLNKIVEHRKNFQPKKIRVDSREKMGFSRV